MSYNTNVIMGKVVGLEIEIALRDEMVRTIRQRIITSLEALQRFLGLNENRFDEICAGIYTYALEEYGKILYLTKLPPLGHPKNNRVKVNYTNDRHGFLNHYHKFQLALDDPALPNTCKVLKRGSFSSSFSSSYTHDNPADFETRKAIFFTDFDKTNNNYNSIQNPPPLNRDTLVTAVNDFLQFIIMQPYP